MAGLHEKMLTAEAAMNKEKDKSSAAYKKAAKDFERHAENIQTRLRTLGDSLSKKRTSQAVSNRPVNPMMAALAGGGVTLNKTSGVPARKSSVSAKKTSGMGGTLAQMAAERAKSSKFDPETFEKQNAARYKRDSSKQRAPSVVLKRTSRRKSKGSAEAFYKKLTKEQKKGYKNDFKRAAESSKNKKMNEFKKANPELYEYFSSLKNL